MAENRAGYVLSSLREMGLDPQSVKAARRLQGLPSNYVYGIILVKRDDGDWILSVQSQSKAELITQ